MPQVSGYASVDTGTKFSCVDIAVMEALGIEACGARGMLGVTSKQRLDAPVFAATLTFPGSNVGELTLADCVGVNLE